MESFSNISAKLHKEAFTQHLLSWFTSVLWYGLLALTIPAISIWQWPFDFQLDELNFFALNSVLTTGAGYVYLLLCCIIFLLFAGFGKRRRVVLLAFALTLLTVERVGLDHTVMVILGLAVTIILFEAVRQNIPFFRDCQRKQIPVTRLAYRSLILWSPLMVFLYLGIMVNHWIMDSSRDFIYQTLPMVDEYCEASTFEGDRVLQCTSLQDEVKREQVKSLTLEQNFSFHIRSAFLNRQKQIIEDLKKLKVSDGKLEMSLRQFSAILDRMSPSDIVLKSDPQVRELFDKAEKLQKQKDRSKADSEKEKIKKAEEQLLIEGKRLAEEKYSEVDLIVSEDEKKKNPNMENWMAVGIAHAFLIGILDADFKKTRETMLDSAPRVFGWGRRYKANKVKISRSLLIEYIIKQTSELSDKTEKYFLDIQAKQSTLKNSNSSLSVRKQNMKMIILAILDVEPQCMTNETAPPFECFAIPADGLPLDTLGLWTSVDHSIDYWHEQRVRDIQESFRTVVKDVSAKRIEADAAVKNLFDDSIPKAIPGLKPNGDCAWYSISCHVSDSLISKINRGYKKERKKIKKKYNQVVSELGKNTETETLNKLWIAKDNLSIALNESVHYMHKTVEAMNTYAVISTTFLTFILILAVIKSFLYVLSTELFDSRELANIELDRSAGIEGEFVAGSSMTIPRSFERPLITRTVLDNQTLRKVIAAWPLSAPFGRILKGCYFFFNKGTHRKQSNNPMSFSQSEGKSIIDWRMKEGEEVVFHYRNFFGASDNIKLKTTISLRLPTLLLGRFVFHSAYCTDGPGKLLLITNGQVVEDQSMIDSTTLDRLIAYNKHTRFKVDSERTIRSVFMDGYTIVRLKEEGRPPGLMLVEAISSSHSMLSGSLRFVKSLLMPF